MRERGNKTYIIFLYAKKKYRRDEAEINKIAYIQDVWGVTNNTSVKQNLITIWKILMT